MKDMRLRSRSVAGSPAGSLAWPFAGPFALAVLLGCSVAHAQEFRVDDVPAAATLAPGQLKPKTIAFSDHRSDDLADKGTGLIRFEDWARERPLQKQILSLYPAYAEPTVTVTVNGLSKPYKEKLEVYVAEARFLLSKPPAAIGLERFARLDFLNAIDPSIKHQTITADQAIPNRDPEWAYNRKPDRAWCEAPGSLCISSRYQFEGKLPIGIRLANKLEEGGKKVADFLEFQSELKVLSAQEVEQENLAKLTGLASPIAGAIEQNVFYVNQVMQSGKLLAVLQAHPQDPGKTVATVFMALDVETDVLEKKREFERVPVLRNLVPAQVLMGNSSFNSGQSLSAGLPAYVRNRIAAMAGLLEGN
jgi:hypothetical protein